MPLINCPECSKSVSDKAASCPDCGYPIYQAVTGGKTNLDPSTTIEQTGKKWKKMKLIAAGLIVGGLIITSAGGAPIGVIMMMVGIVAGVYSMFGSWWHHS